MLVLGMGTVDELNQSLLASEQLREELLASFWSLEPNYLHCTSDHWISFP